MGMRLRGMVGDSEKVYPLDKPVTTIGRLPDNDIVLSADTVSRRHGRVVVADGVATYTDLSSTCGTSINGVGVGESQLRAGDRIAITQYLLVFESGDVELPPMSDVYEIPKTDPPPERVSVDQTQGAPALGLSVVSRASESEAE